MNQRNKTPPPPMTIEKIARGEKPETPIAKFSKVLDRMKPQLAMALPRHLNADRMARLALTQFSTNPALQECDSNSILGGLMTAAQLGLEIGVNGQAYLIPYKGRATLVPGWRGLVDLVNRSGRATVWTGAVFEGDTFDYALGDSPFVKHKPGNEDDPDALLFVYAIGRVRDAQQPVIEVWSMPKIWKHRDRFNKVGRKHYSFEHPEMYARKIPLLQVLKYMPSSIELTTAMSLSDAADSGEGMVIDGETFVTPSPETVDGATGEITQGGGVSAFDATLLAIENAGDAEAAALVLDAARSELDEPEMRDLAEKYRSRWQ